MNKILKTSFLLYLIMFQLFLILNINNANCEWYNNDWQWRKSHVINSASGSGTYYQIRITCQYESGSDIGETIYLDNLAQTDFDDVRITDDDGITLLDIWLQIKVDSDYAIFWIEVKDDLSSSAQTIYIYVGNPSATSVSNGDDTFLFFDDFSYVDSPLNHGWSAIQTGLGGTYSVDGTKLILDATVNTGWARIIDGYSSSIGIAVDFKAYINNFYATDFQYKSSGGINRVTAVPLSGYQTMMGSVGKNGLCRRMDTWATIYTTSMQATTGIWYLCSYRVYGSQTLELFVDGVSKGSGSSSAFIVGYDGIEINSIKGYYDDYRVRKYVSPEPTHGAWGEWEEVTYGIVTNISAVINNMDDTDNIYAQKRWYNLTAEFNHSLSYEWFDYVDVFLNDSITLKLRLRYYEDNNTFLIIYGSSKFELNISSGYYKSGYNLSVFWLFKPKWNCDPDIDMEISLFSCDNESNTDLDIMQNNYCDIITDVSLNNANLNVTWTYTNSPINFNGTLVYSQSSNIFVPDNEIKDIILHNTTNVKWANDNSTSNGYFDMVFNSGNKKTIQIFHVYVDLNDTEFNDVDESNTFYLLIDVEDINYLKRLNINWFMLFIWIGLICFGLINKYLFIISGIFGIIFGIMFLIENSLIGIFIIFTSLYLFYEGIID